MQWIIGNKVKSSYNCFQLDWKQRNFLCQVFISESRSFFRFPVHEK